MVVCEIVGKLIAVDGEKKTVEIDAGVIFVNTGNVHRRRSSVVTIEVPDLNQLREAGKLLYEMVRLVGTRRNPEEATKVAISKHERTSCPTQ